MDIPLAFPRKHHKIKLFPNEYRCQLASDNLRLLLTAVAMHEFKNSMMLQPMLLSLEIRAMDNKLINWITFHRFEHGKAMNRKTFGLNKSSEDLLIYFRIERKSCAYLVCKISLSSCSWSKTRRNSPEAFSAERIFLRQFNG